MLWMTRTFPKTSRGHPWHVHIRWNKWGGRKPARNWPWWERLWGKANRDFRFGIVYDVRNAAPARTDKGFEKVHADYRPKIFARTPALAVLVNTMTGMKQMDRLMEEESFLNRELTMIRIEA